jgi:outer membrane protein OmpA-like peptidoglycan-associated protein
MTGSLAAINGVGSSIATSAFVNYITAVGAPTSVVVSNGDGQVTLAFSINSGGDTIVSFDYSLDGLSYSPLNVTSSPLTITGLTNDVSYNLYLRAKGATYGEGTISAAIAVLPYLTVVAVSQVAPTPSYLKAIKHPVIIATQSTYLCSRGEYQFARSGGGVEAFTSASTIYKLYINGALIDSATVQSTSYAFEKSELLQASTVSCSVTLSQESVTNEFSSLSNPLFKGIEKIKNESYSTASDTYQIARDAAYSLRVEGDTGSIETWRKSMEIALSQRQAAEDVANAIYVKALEKEGISLFFGAASVKKPVVTKPVEVIKTPDKTNVQPTSTMRKVGTIYFANGTYFINDASRRSIITIASKINQASAKTVLSYGHTDSTGGVNNILLSKNRSKAVAALLRDALSGKKVMTGWYAATKPISTGTSKADLAKNRRVEIYIK